MLHAAPSVTFALDAAHLDDLPGMITIAQGTDAAGAANLTAAEPLPAFGFQRPDAADIERSGRARPAPFSRPDHDGVQVVPSRASLHIRFPHCSLKSRPECHGGWSGPEALCCSTLKPDWCYAMSMSNDTKAIIGTGIGLATLLLVLIGLMFQQNANVNARIDDVQSSIRDLRADVQADIQDLRADIRELREIVINAPKGSNPAD